MNELTAGDNYTIQDVIFPFLPNLASDVVIDNDGVVTPTYDLTWCAEDFPADVKDMFMVINPSPGGIIVNASIEFDDEEDDSDYFRFGHEVAVKFTKTDELKFMLYVYDLVTKNH